MRTVTTSCGEGRLVVSCQLTTTGGQGIVAFLYGGDLPHVGGHALASPGPQLHGAQLSHADVWSTTVPGHKDAELAALVARKLCLASGEPASVTVGIHVDDATPEQIKMLCTNAVEAAVGALAGSQVR